ncbi:MAG: hypothetical protein KC619_30455 [Myxococcales bacterium]|nr:hypothetical protein [Myxococcales bacterium]
MRPLRIALALLAVGCGGRAIPLVQAAHAREFRCDRRYVQVDRIGEDRHRFRARGCGFEAEWQCRDGECEVEDACAWGMGAP